MISSHYLWLILGYLVSYGGKGHRISYFVDDQFHWGSGRRYCEKRCRVVYRLRSEGVVKILAWKVDTQT